MGMPKSFRNCDEINLLGKKPSNQRQSEGDCMDLIVVKESVGLLDIGVGGKDRLRSIAVQGILPENRVGVAGDISKML